MGDEFLVGKVGMINNPAAGLNRKKGYTHDYWSEYLHNVYNKQPGLCNKFLICEPESPITNPGSLKEAIAQFKDFGVSAESGVIVISGGDGTGVYTLTEIIKQYEDSLPHILWLPSGTVNMIARDVGVKSYRPKRVFKRFLRKIKNNEQFEIATRYLLRVRDTLEKKEKYGFIFGNGVFFNFLKIYYNEEDPEDPGIPTSWKALKMLWKGVRAAKKGSDYAQKFLWSTHQFLKMDVQEKEKPEEHELEDYLVVAAATIQNLGAARIYFNAFDKANIVEEAFHLLCLKMTPRELAKTIWDLKLRGRRPPKDKTLERLVSRLIVTCKETQRPDDLYGYTLDGENIEYTYPYTIMLTTGPKVRFITG